MRIPKTKRNIFRRDFDKSSARFGQPPSQQTAQTELSSVINVEALLRLERQVECLGGGRRQQSMSRLHRLHQRILLKTAAVFQNRITRLQFLIRLVPPRETLSAESSRRPHTCRRISGIVHQKRTKLSAKKSSRVKR